MGPRLIFAPKHRSEQRVEEKRDADKARDGSDVTEPVGHTAEHEPQPGSDGGQHHAAAHAVVGLMRCGLLVVSVVVSQW